MVSLQYILCEILSDTSQLTTIRVPCIPVSILYNSCSWCRMSHTRP